MNLTLKITLSIVVLLALTSTATAQPVFTQQQQQRDSISYQHKNKVKTPNHLFARIPMALKTNLLYDLVALPNIGIEVAVAPQITISGDFTCTNWGINNYAHLRTTQGSVAGKYWFDNTWGYFTGWSAGVYFMYSGNYDVQWFEGYQGDRYFSTGITGSYSTCVSKMLKLEFALSVGYFYTPEVRHFYRGDKNHLIWTETRYNVARFAPTKAEISLVWVLNGKKR